MQYSEDKILIARNPYSIIHDNRSRPFLEIELSPFTKHGIPVSMSCLLDTGADYNIFPASLCKELGHDMENGIGDPVEINGVCGKTNVHLHTNKITFCGETFECDFFMCKDSNYDEIGLLGHYGVNKLHRGFFSKYIVSFNTPARYYEIFKPIALPPSS